MKRLSARGVLSAAGVKAEACQVAAAPPIWFVFSGEAAPPLQVRMSFGMRRHGG